MELSHGQIRKLQKFDVMESALETLRSFHQEVSEAAEQLKGEDWGDAVDKIQAAVAKHGEALKQIDWELAP